MTSASLRVVAARLPKVGVVAITAAFAIHCAPDRPRTAGSAQLPASVAKCGSCHAQTVASFVHTAHFRTSAEADPQTVHGHFERGRNRMTTGARGLYFVMSARDDGLYQTAVDSVNHQTLTQRFDIVVGSGRRGQSYLYWSNRLLFQLPISYLTAADDWINSPGYRDGTADFGRPVVPRCLECHATAFSVERSGNRLVYGRRYELGVTCAKCHGDASAHIAFAEANPSDRAGAAKLVMNPARLDRERRIDNCALCHAGNPPTLAPAFTYTVGERLSTYLAPDSSAPVPDVHGNQVGLLRLSRCFRFSPDMTCSTCHNVHEVQRDIPAFAAKCQQCHEVAKHPRRQEIGQRMTSQCVNCHMPIAQSSALQIYSAQGMNAFSMRSHRIAIYPDVAARVLKETSR